MFYRLINKGQSLRLSVFVTHMFIPLRMKELHGPVFDNPPCYWQERWYSAIICTWMPVHLAGYAALLHALRSVVAAVQAVTKINVITLRPPIQQLRNRTVQLATSRY